MRKSAFIVIEALDAGGSQTQTDLLADRLRREGSRPLALHFPQEDRATGRLIYDKFLLEKNTRPFTRREQSLLYIQDFFSRSEDMWTVIRGQARETIVISDRFITSTMAYQTIGLSGRKRQEMIAWIEWLGYKGKPALPKPDRVILLDTPVTVSLARLKSKRRDHFETRQKLAAIHRSYLQLADEQKWIIVGSLDERGRQRSRPDIHREIWQSLSAVVR